jgi:uncharacterized membrane protein
MTRKTAITINRPREEVERLWQSSEHRPDQLEDAAVTFKEAPGDRGTEIHVEIPRKLLGAPRLAKVKDGLRRFKQHVETGVIARSEGTPEGEKAERKLKQRPAQPLSQEELQKVGVS